MSGFIYAGPSGDQYEKFKAEYLAKEAAEKAKTIEADVVTTGTEVLVEEVAEIEAPKKATRTTTKK